MNLPKAKSLAEYHGDRLLQAAVEGKLQVVGEALGKAIRIDISLTNDIDEHSSIIALRNRLVHGYDDISSDLIWNIVEKHAPKLEVTLKRLLSDV